MAANSSGFPGCSTKNVVLCKNEGKLNETTSSKDEHSDSPYDGSDQDANYHPESEVGDFWLICGLSSFTF